MRAVIGVVGLMAVAACTGGGAPASSGQGGAPTAGFTNSGGATSDAGACSAPCCQSDCAASGGGGNLGGAHDGGTDDRGAGTGGGDGGAGDDRDPDEPEPVIPDLTGLLPHSTQWMLLSRTPPGELNSPDDIQLLDLETMQLTPGNPERAINVLSWLSPDERTFFFSNANGNALSERIIHLEPSGFVPARKLKDYEKIPGAYSVLSWSFDSRFALVARGAAPSSIELIDMWLEKRVHTEAFSSIVAGFAPAGYGFFYDAALTEGYEPRYARVTRDGTSPIQKLPPDAADMVFDRSGEHLFYSLGAVTESQRLFVVSLASGLTTELPAAEGDEQARGYDMLPLTDSVLVTVRTDTSSFKRRVFLDPEKSWSTVADHQVVRHSDDNRLLISQDSVEKRLALVRVEPHVSRTLPVPYGDTSKDSWVGIVGDHAFYSATDGLHLARLSATGELQDHVVSSPGQATTVCASRFSVEPPEKLVFVQGAQEELVFVDLTQEPPVVVGSYTAPVGSKVYCPTWGDAGNALGFLVQAADDSRSAYVTRWTGTAPETPKLALENAMRIYALMLR